MYNRKKDWKMYFMQKINESIIRPSYHFFQVFEDDFKEKNFVSIQKNIKLELLIIVNVKEIILMNY